MSMNKLKEIVGSTSTQRIPKDDTFGQAQINKSEDWLLQNTDANPKDKTKAWMKEFSDWGFTSNNRDYYWKTMEDISPLDSASFQEFTTNDIRKKADSFTSLEQKENYFRDNAYTWPSYALEKLEGYFTGIRGANAAKDLERNRLSQIIELKETLSKKSFALNPNVSIESHSEEMVKAYDMGYREEVDINNEGRLSIPIDGEMVALYTIPDPELSMEEEFISLKDLREVVKSKFKPMLQESRTEQTRIENTTKKALMSRVKQGDIPKEFRSNVIIDGALLEKDPMKAAMGTLLESVDEKRKRGSYPSVKEMYLDYRSQYFDLFDKVQRRLEDGKYS